METDSSDCALLLQLCHFLILHHNHLMHIHDEHMMLTADENVIWWEMFRKVIDITSDIQSLCKRAEPNKAGAYGTEIFTAAM